MNLYILRHGIAADLTHGRDADRPLTPKGRRKMRQIAEAIERLDLGIKRILTSPYARARETAEIVAKRLKLKEALVFAEELTPGGTFRELVQRLKDPGAHAEDILLVGHEPCLSGFISLLTANTSLRLKLKKGGLCKLSVDELKQGRCATLEWLLTPDQLVLIAC